MVRAWGFGYKIGDDKETLIDSKKLYFGTTELWEDEYPKQHSKLKNAKEDSLNTVKPNKK